MVSVYFEKAKDLLSSLDAPVWVLHREWEEEDVDRDVIKEARVYVGGSTCSVKFGIKSLLSFGVAITAQNVNSLFQRPDPLRTYVNCYPRWQDVHHVSFKYDGDTVIVTRVHRDGTMTQARFHKEYLDSVMAEHTSFDVCDQHFSFIEPETTKARFTMQTAGGNW